MKNRNSSVKICLLLFGVLFHVACFGQAKTNGRDSTYGEVVYQLPDVDIKFKPRKQISSDTRNQSLFGNVKFHNIAGAECELIMKMDTFSQAIYLSSISFKIASRHCDSYRLSLVVYTMDPNNAPGDELIHTLDSNYIIEQSIHKNFVCFSFTRKKLMLQGGFYIGVKWEESPVYDCQTLHLNSRFNQLKMMVRSRKLTNNIWVDTGVIENNTNGNTGFLFKLVYY